MVRAIAIAAFALLVVGSTGCNRYHEEVTRISRHVEVVAYYPSVDAPDPSHVEVRMDGRRVWRTSQDEMLMGTSVVGGRIFLTLLYTEPTARKVVGVLCSDGRLGEIWDLTELLKEEGALVESIDCKPRRQGTIRVDLYYRRAATDDELYRIQRDVSSKDLPCAPLVVLPSARTVAPRKK